MAITGSGTQADPWIAQSYTDLQTAFSNLRTYGGTKYLELSNDIDCNDYGSNFTWSALSVGNTNNAMIFDLKGHSIKNVSIASGSTMFTFGGNSQSIVKNGKILNVFMNNAIGFNNYVGGLYTCGKLQNLSVSANVNGATSNVFNAAIDSCALYAEGSISNPLIRLQDNVNEKCINSDILLAIDRCDSAFDNLSAKVVSNCRIRGKANITGTALSNAYASFENCVFDLETNAIYISTYNSGSPSGVINTDKYQGRLEGLVGVTSAEIINGDSLRTIGFVVVNVSA
jgi:hypothetical protein